MEKTKKYQKRQYAKQPSRPRSNKPSFIDNLVTFKLLKDQGNEQALEVWNEYQRSKDEKVFEEGVAGVVLHYQAKADIPVPVDIQLPVEVVHEQTSHEPAVQGQEIELKDDNDADTLLADALKGLMSSHDSDEKLVPIQEDAISPHFQEQPFEPPYFHPGYPPSMMPHFQPQFLYPMPMPPHLADQYHPNDMNMMDQLHHRPMYPPFPMPYPPHPYPFEGSFPPGFMPGHYPPPFPPPQMMFVPPMMPVPPSIDTSLHHQHHRPTPDSLASSLPVININISPDIIKPIDLDMLTEPSSTVSLSEGFDTKIEESVAEVLTPSISDVTSTTGISMIYPVVESPTPDVPMTQDIVEPNDEEAMMQSRVLRMGLNKKNKHESKANNKASKKSTAPGTPPPPSLPSEVTLSLETSLVTTTTANQQPQSNEETTKPLSTTESKSKALLSFLKSHSNASTHTPDRPVEAETHIPAIESKAQPPKKAPPKVLKRRDDIDPELPSPPKSTMHHKPQQQESVDASPASTDPTTASVQTNPQPKVDKRRQKKAVVDNKVPTPPTLSIPESNSTVDHNVKPYPYILTMNQPIAIVKAVATEPEVPITTAPPPANRSHQLRTTRHQVGTLSISTSIAKPIYRPNQSMNIIWELPYDMMMNNDTMISSEKADLVIGLTRYGSAVNHPCIIAKHISKSNDIYVDAVTGIAYMRGKMPFYAPRSAGRFVYRLYDQSSAEKARTTLASSSDYHVELDEPNLDLSLKFIHDLFQDKKDKNASLKAVTQFNTLVDGIRPFSIGRGLRVQDRIQSMSSCIDHVIKILIDHGKILDDALSQQQPSSDAVVVIGNDQPVAGIGIAMKIHHEIHVVFQSLKRNTIIWESIPHDMRLTINNIISCYCPLLQRFFSSIDNLLRARQLYFTFTPASSSIQISSSIVEHLNASILEMIPSLIPSIDFDYHREEIRRRIHDMVSSSNIVPYETSIELYGSSKNNFGNSSSDVDMCIVFAADSGYDDRYKTIEERGRLMEEIGGYLMMKGMLEVQVIATARIPVVNFRDPVTGLECDVTYHNPLAIKNTLLLRAYSEIDPRVRIVAYIIKHWAKSRQVNNPGDGTLSSYGFILCLIHFLQAQPMPIIPNLQAIPPDWNGDASSHINHHHHHHDMRQYEENAADGTKCNVSYHHPTMMTQPVLKAKASKNSDSPALLLIKFFHYYAYKFDYINDIVSIQASDAFPALPYHHQPSSSSSGCLKKIDKAESDGWLLHDRLSIEDPFETWYDVAHVIKKAQMKYMKKEFIRAYTIISRAEPSSSYVHRHDDNDALPSMISSRELLKMICEACDPPPFARDKKKAEDEYDDEA